MNSRKDLHPEFAAWQQRLGDAPRQPRGRRYWRSLEELAESEAFAALIEQEFPEQADQWPDALSRRRFLTVMAASLALGGIHGCSVRPAPAAKIVPYVRPQADITPGRPLFFATTMTQTGDAVGLLVESHMGRPTKIEGNPDHPASLGACGVQQQASVLTLYDPDRSQTVTFEGQIRGWSDAEQALRRAMSAQKSKAGAGLRILTETVVSPTLAWQFQNLLSEYPAAKWHQYDRINDDNLMRGAELAFGERASTVYDFAKADIVLALDSDFLASGPGCLRYARDFMARRRLPIAERDVAQATMNRMYVAEPAPTCTGAKADHRLAVRGSQVEELARALAVALEAIPAGGLAAGHQQWIAAAASDLQAHRGRSLVLAGYRQPPPVHLLAHAINEQLGNVGQTVRYIQPVAGQPVDRLQSLRDLAADIEGGQVELLVLLGGNPVFTAPADFRLAEILPRAALRFHLSLYVDETSHVCQWHLPAAHYLESWSDARAFDGTASIVQPLIEPLYKGRSGHELVAVLAGLEHRSGDRIVRDYWRQHGEGRTDDVFEDWWQTSLHDGVIAESAFAAKDLRLQDDWQQHLEQGTESLAGLELAFDADPTILDGTQANNGWLQELPKPITKLTWDNAALVSPVTAVELGVKLGSPAHGGEHGGYQAPVVELHLAERRLRAPVWIVPGHADGVVTVHLGYGRRAAGRIGGDAEHLVGFDAGALRTSANPWFANDVRVVPTGSNYSLACTQVHHALEGDDIVRGGTLMEFREQPRRWQDLPPEHFVEGRSIYGAKKDGGAEHQWGMLIDLTTCTGCSACTVACQAENNIPVVGKEQVLFGREMHWLRIDRYMSGPADSPAAVHFQPLPCMHCEHAPCEYVCPVAATVHSADGLNDMVYNRCVGTRFCSNNCPYKVRRFNFLAYGDFTTPTRRLQYNPDVTVRSRGVMEKCTYCVQRIRSAEMDARAASRPLADGEILTACQAACPTKAIVFGDLNDAQSAVRRAKSSPLEYGLLTELNTFPRTTYLAEVRNPNPALQAAES